jgi:hypothetical protein
MTQRFSHMLMMCLVLGSMWLHGSGFVMPMNDEMDMNTMGSTCLEHCLQAVHVEESDEGAGVAPVAVVWSESIESVVIPYTNLVIDLESHHDPTRVLTTIKRE